MVTDSNSQTTSVFARPWAQLIIGIICMVMIANLQYGWTLFVGPIGDKYHWGKAAIQVTFTIFVLLETWLVPAEGYLVDRFGPKWIVVIGGVLCGIAWTINSVADSLGMFYFAAALGGIGAGGVYGTCIGNAVRWFPGRRGLAAGKRNWMHRQRWPGTVSISKRFLVRPGSISSIKRPFSIPSWLRSCRRWRRWARPSRLWISIVMAGQTFT